MGVLSYIADVIINNYNFYILIQYYKFNIIKIKNRVQILYKFKFYTQL